MELIFDGKKERDKIVKKAKAIAKEYQAAPNLSNSGFLCYGDNFHWLPRLLKNYSKSIDLVYIDPPFNTGNKFFQSDEKTSNVSKFGNANLAYDDSFDFDEYLEYMYERFILIRQLMSSQGTIYLHIDVKVGHYLKLLLDEVFGRENFINEISRVKCNPKNMLRKSFGNYKDTIYIYSKYPKENIFNDIRNKVPEEDLETQFPKVEFLTGRRYATVSCNAPGETINGVTGGEWRGVLPPKGRHWRCSPEELDKLDKQGRIEWSKNKVPRLKMYADEHQGNKIQDIWLDFKDPQNPIYPTEKNHKMLKMIIDQSSNPNSIVMDCFCGSGAFLFEALKSDRYIIGIDKSKVAIRIAKERLNSIDKIKLFK